MDNILTGINPKPVQYPEPPPRPRLLPNPLTIGERDRVELGAGEPLTTGQAMNVVVERAIEKLRSVVTEAREALGIPEEAPLDISPEATANRILDFGLGAFEAWRRNHSGLTEEDARVQFAGFIGGAIMQGIEEARGILTALNALTPEVDQNIQTTVNIIQQRLEEFAANI